MKLLLIRHAIAVEREAFEGDDGKRPLTREGIGRMRRAARGLARVAAGVLRDAGFDVVGFGNTAERRDSTVVRDRSGHSEWANAAARVMGPAQVEGRADSGRLVDLTVVIGARWRPPTEPLRP